MRSFGSVRSSIVVLAATALAFTMLVACGKTLNGTYAMSENHATDFNSNDTCVMRDNGVSWSGSYSYESSLGVYKVEVSQLGGSVKTYGFIPSGADLVLRENGYDFVYKKQAVAPSGNDGQFG